MQKVQGIGGVFFRAKDPDALAEWYETHLGIDILNGIWMADGGPTVFMPFDAQTDYFDRDTQQFMINFRVEDLGKMVTQLEAAGISVIRKPEWDMEVGQFARIHDPDGNPVELWQSAVPS